MKQKIIAPIISVIIWVGCRAVDIGSDTAVTRFNARQTINNTDRIAGFAALAGGLRVSRQTNTVTFDSFFSVSGDIGMSHANLILNQDLILDDVSNMRELGNITGNYHNIGFSSSVTTVPVVNIGDDSFRLTLVSSFTALADDVLTCDWSPSGSMLAVGQAAVAAAHDLIQIYSFNGTTLRLVYTQPRDQYVAINSIRWHPSLNLLAVGRQSSAGAEVLIYSVNPATGVMTSASTLEVGANVYAVDWHPTGNWLAFGRAPNPEIAVHAVTSGGVIGGTAVATYNMSGNRTVANEALRWDSTGNYLAFGLLTSAVTDLNVLSYNQVTPALTLNASFEAGATVSAVEWNPVNKNLLAVGITGTTGNLFRLFSHNSGAGTLTNVGNIAGLAQTVRSIAWRPSIGDAFFFGRFATTGDELQGYAMVPTTTTLSAQVEGFNYTGNLNVVRWSRNGQYIAAAGADNQVDVYRYWTAQEGSVSFSNVNLLLTQDTFFFNEINRFTGQSIIDGGGCTLTLATTCSIIVETGASLMFKDITINNVRGDKIQMVDSTGTLTLNNVHYVMDSNYTMTHGKMVVLGDFTISGEGNSFVYQTDQISTISTNARLILDNDVTFSYVPRVSSRSLINLLSPTSELVLNGATLYTTTTGLRLATGRLTVDRLSSLYNQGTVESEAISFANNLDFQYAPAALLDCLSGLVVYE